VSGPRFLIGRSRAAAAASAERPVDVFVRGLLSGALVGAVIAGSAMWERRQRRRLAASAAGQGSPMTDPATSQAHPPAQAAPDEIVSDADPGPRARTTG
jgi:hypothetical protein